MERLTRADIDNIDLIAFENYSVHECLQDIDTVDYINILNALTKLQDYEDMEEEGTLLKLPCKINDIVYTVDKSKQIIKSMKICNIQITTYKIIYFNWIANEKPYTYNKTGFFLDDLNKTVFLTKEAAEEELKKMEEK